jgi:ferrous iron transport protein A
MKSDFKVEIPSGALESGEAQHRCLRELPPGVDAVIVSIDDAGAVGGRLLDLGLLPGTSVRLLRRAPLGDPSVYELRGYRLCLRGTESERVVVRVVAPSPELG